MHIIFKETRPKEQQQPEQQQGKKGVGKEGRKPASCHPAQAAAPSHSEVRKPRSLNVGRRLKNYPPPPLPPSPKGRRLKKYWTISFFNRRPTLIYDIGTEILCKTCFGHNSTQNERKSTILGRIFTEFYVDSESGIKTRFKAFFKSASNLVLIADSESTQNFVKIRTNSSSVGAFCVELWPKQVLYRLFAPMSYNSW